MWGAKLDRLLGRLSAWNGGEVEGRARGGCVRYGRVWGKCARAGCTRKKSGESFGLDGLSDAPLLTREESMQQSKYGADKRKEEWFGIGVEGEHAFHGTVGWDCSCSLSAAGPQNATI